MKHALLLAMIAGCQPVPAYEFDTHEGKPIIRLTDAEAMLCASREGCKLVTEAAIKSYGEQAYRAGYLKAVQDTLRKPQ
jgi:hypothetical protein